VASRGGGIDARPAGNAVRRRTERHPQRTSVARTDPACRIARTSPRQTKADLVETLIRQALQLIGVKQHCAPYLAALGLLLNRTPFHAGPESVVPPEMVARTYDAFQDFDWAEAELLELHMLFLRAARVVGDRSLDIPKSLRNQIATKLERAGVAPARTGSIKAFTPVGRAERSTLYGESLPPGLLLGSGQDDER